MTTTVVVLAPAPEAPTLLAAFRMAVGGVTSSSKAPMSVMPSMVRAKPRWSEVSVKGAPVLWAGLALVMAMVSVGPPLFCSEPSSGSICVALVVPPT